MVGALVTPPKRGPVAYTPYAVCVNVECTTVPLESESPSAVFRLSPAKWRTLGTASDDGRGPRGSAEARTGCVHPVRRVRERGVYDGPAGIGEPERRVQVVAREVADVGDRARRHGQRDDAEA